MHGTSEGLQPPVLCDGMEEDFANKKKRAVELAAEKAAKEAVEKGLEPPAAPAPHSRWT